MQCKNDVKPSQLGLLNVRATLRL